MALISMRQMLDHAAEFGYGVPAFNVNNLEQMRAIMEAADRTDSPVIVQASAGARKYAGAPFLRHLILAAIEEFPHIPVCMRQDRGTSPAGTENGDPQGWKVMVDLNIMGALYTAHAAMPHLGRDPITAAGQVLLALQTITARNVNPLQSAVISPTQILPGDTWRVIPATATIRGTVRTFAPDIQDLVEDRLKTVADATAKAFDCTARVMYQRRYPATINSEAETAIAFAAASRVVGADQIDQNPEPSMASEDFAFMLNAKPGSYVWLGNGPTDGNCLLHNAAYDFNDAAIPYGVSYWISLVEECLSA